MQVISFHCVFISSAVLFWDNVKKSCPALYNRYMPGGGGF